MYTVKQLYILIHYFHLVFSRQFRISETRQLKTLYQKTGNHWVIQDDLILPKSEFQRLTRNKNRPFTKSFKGNGILKWDQYPRNGRFLIGYKIKPEWFGTEKTDYMYGKKVSEWDKIKNELPKALKDIESKTALKFIDISKSNRNKFRHWIEYIGEPKATWALYGCRSILGRSGGFGNLIKGDGGQLISLGRGCVIKTTIIHETLHSLGWIHEQNRPDRDENVNIVWKNIKAKDSKNFVKQTSSLTSGTPYDFNSIMHYHNTAFSNSTGPTITSKIKNKKIFTINEWSSFNSKIYRQGLSGWDAYEINKIYNLNQHCKDRGMVWGLWNDAPGKNEPKYEVKLRRKDTCVHKKHGVLKTCDDLPCGANRICKNIKKAPGFICKRKIDPCRRQNCMNGKCEADFYSGVQPTPFKCICKSSFMGKRCEVKINCSKGKRFVLDEKSYLARACEKPEKYVLNLSGLGFINGIGASAFDEFQNDIDTLKFRQSNIKSIEYYYSDRYEQKKTAFNSLRSLKNLDLSYNYIDRIPELAFYNNYLLEKLDISHNRLSGLLSEKLFQSSLKIIFLNDNPELILREETFKNLVKIKKLWIHNTNGSDTGRKILCRKLKNTGKVEDECCYGVTQDFYRNDIRLCL